MGLVGAQPSRNLIKGGKSLGFDIVGSRTELSLVDSQPEVYLLNPHLTSCGTIAIITQRLEEFKW